MKGKKSKREAILLIFVKAFGNGVPGVLLHCAKFVYKLGFLDIAGGGVVHLLGAQASIVGSAMVGPRLGRYVLDTASGKVVDRPIHGHSGYLKF